MNRDGGALYRQICLCSTTRESAAACAVSLIAGHIACEGSASMQCQARDETLVMGKGEQSCTAHLSGLTLSQKQPGGGNTCRETLSTAVCVCMLGPLQVS